MTFTVRFTNRAWPDSEVVDRVWYDNTAEDLYVELHGYVYKYPNVPERVYEEFVNAGSVGRFYGNSIKGKYRPASRLGPVSDLAEVRVLAKATKVEAPNTADLNRLTVSQARAVVTGTPQLSLTKDVPAKHVGQVENAYEFTFVLEGDENKAQRKHTLKASSEDEALDELFELGRLLDQDIVPVSATVYYSN
jgi:hypothetical protein